MRLWERINVGRRACDIQGGIGIIGRITAWHPTPCVRSAGIYHISRCASRPTACLSLTPKCWGRWGQLSMGRWRRKWVETFFCTQDNRGWFERRPYWAFIQKKKKNQGFPDLTEWQRLNNLWRTYEKTRPSPQICCTKVPTPIPQREWDGTGRGKKRGQGATRSSCGTASESF